MITTFDRPRFPKPKPVMLVNDIPVKAEIAAKETFSAISNMNLLSALQTGRCIRGVSAPAGHKGIFATKVYTTYLDYSYYTEGNYHFKEDFAKRKDLQSVEKEGKVFLIRKSDNPELNVNILEQLQFYLLPHQKDCYVKHRLWECLQGLLQEIREVKPNMIITTGRWVVFLLAGVSSVAENTPVSGDAKPLGCISKYRSSILELHPCWELPPIILVPIMHTINAIGMLDKIPIMDIDLQKIGWMFHVIEEHGVRYFLQPEKEYILGTSLEVIKDYLGKILSLLEVKPTKLTVDIETRFHSTIDCIGLTASVDSGICIPFMSIKEPNLWDIEEEVEILLALRQVLTHPNARFIFHNGSYDVSFIWEQWMIDLPIAEDTMVKHHCLWNYLPKNLGFVASIQSSSYRYWKDEA